MSRHLKFFALEHCPPEAVTESDSELGTESLREALTVIRSSLRDGCERICVAGQPGLGKTRLARAIPDLLGDEARVAVLFDPWIPWDALFGSVAKQWRVDPSNLDRSNLISNCPEDRLMLVVDQAETASTDFLERLDVLLGYRNDQDEPIVQIVLLANLSQQNRKVPAPLVWWLDQIQTFQVGAA